MVNTTAVCAVISWVIAEVVGKFLLKTLDKRVIAIIAGVATAVGARLTTDITTTDSVALGALLPVITGVVHDKLVNPLLVKGK